MAKAKVQLPDGRIAIVELPDTAEQPVDYEFGRTLENFGPDALNVVKETAQGIPKIPGALAGIYGQAKVGNFEPAKEMGSAMVEDLQGKYGGWDEIKTTAMEHPAEMLLDVAGGVGALGKTAQLAGKGAKALARSNYERLAKFGTTIPWKKRQQLIETALNEGIYPSISGAKKIEDRIDLLNAQLDDIITASQDAGELVPVEVIFQHLSDLRQVKGGLRVDAAKDLRKINAIESGFREQFIGPNGTVTKVRPAELQKIKQDLYRKVKDKEYERGVQGKPPSSTKTETHKAMARGAKDALEELMPGVGPVNQQLGPLYSLQGPLNNAVGRLGNRNWMNLTGTLGGGIVGAGSGVAAAGAPGGAMGALIGSIAMSPMAQRAITSGAWGAGKALDSIGGRVPGSLMAPAAFTMPGRVDDDEDE